MTFMVGNSDYARSTNNHLFTHRVIPRDVSHVESPTTLWHVGMEVGMVGSLT